MTAKKSSLTGVLALGIDALFTETDAEFSMIPLDMIEVNAQIREDFEDSENTLEDLAASIKARGVLQPILLRSTDNGYELIAGERRYRAAKLAGLENIPSFIRKMTDVEAEDAQLAENIHRKNLTQIEEAKKIQRDLDRLGSIEAVLELHQKSRPWLSKMISLLSLPEQTKRLITENVSADVEVINTVKIVEKLDPVKAKTLVDDLKDTRGKKNAREKAIAVKETVKPKKVKTVDIDIFAGAKKVGENVVIDYANMLGDFYLNIAKGIKSPEKLHDEMDSEALAGVTNWLREFYDLGETSNDVSRAVMQGLHNGQFGNTLSSAFALSAFLYGADNKAEFNLLAIFSSIEQ
ncbi:MAG: ParB/RepB/Spo0J family partition protein [Methylococcales bacterium]